MYLTPNIHDGDDDDTINEWKVECNARKFIIVRFRSDRCRSLFVLRMRRSLCAGTHVEYAKLFAKISISSKLSEWYLCCIGTGGEGYEV